MLKLFWILLQPVGDDDDTSDEEPLLTRRAAPAERIFFLIETSEHADGDHRNLGARRRRGSKACADSEGYLTTPPNRHVSRCYGVIPFDTAQDATVLSRS